MEKKKRARLREEWEKLALDWLLPLLVDKVVEAKVKVWVVVEEVRMKEKEREREKEREKEKEREREGEREKERERGKEEERGKEKVVEESRHSTRSLSLFQMEVERFQ